MPKVKPTCYLNFLPNEAKIVESPLRLLSMTRQPTIQLGSQLSVASDAKAHLELYRFEAVHGLYLPVAVAAVQLSPQDMRLMPEKDEVGEDEDAYPGNRLSGQMVFLLLKNFRMFRNHVLVAKKAFFYRRQPGMLRTLHVGMAEATVNLLYPGMDAVAEIDRLPRADPFPGEKIVEVPHGRKKNHSDYQPDIAAFRSSRLWVVVRHI